MPDVLVLSNRPGFALAGDAASEAEVDETAAAVARALKGRGMSCGRLCLSDSVEPLIAALRRGRTRAVFNLCEGLGGSPLGELLVASALERLQVPFTGCPTAALTLCLDKGVSKSLLKAMGFPVPKHFAVLPSQSLPAPLPFRLPAIVKPLRQDGSLGISDASVVRTHKAMDAQVKAIHRRYHEPAIVEEYIAGREFNVSVIADKKPRPLPVSEIDFSGMPRGVPKIVSYAAKWNTDDPRFTGTVPVVPAPIPKAAALRLQRLAADAGRALGCRHYWRVDFRVSKTGRPYIVEVNPNPDLHPDAGLARALKAARIPYGDFVLKVVRWAMES
jgi:D-alanine-D-alanine ligase